MLDAASSPKRLPSQREEHSAVKVVKFTLADFELARTLWGANCGPSTLAVICGLTLDEVRPLFGAKWPGHTNPSMMFFALNRAGVKWSWDSIMVNDARPAWPSWGLARIQWEGPWMQPGVPMSARYRHTHWVGAGPLLDSASRPIPGEVCVWDVNTLDIGSGWAPLAAWTRATAPILTRSIKRASGGWHITHAIEVHR